MQHYAPTRSADSEVLHSDRGEKGDDDGHHPGTDDAGGVKL
jgi:hypothetical protein